MPRVVLVIGVSGAGKTTVARALAARFDRSACIGGDHIQHGFTVSGIVGPDKRPRHEARRQLALRWRNCAMLADSFAAEDFTVVVENGASECHWIDLFLRTLRTRPLSIIVLAPHPDVARQRDRDRREKQVAHRFMHEDAEMRANLADVGWWLDTSALSLEETVDAIVEVGLEGGETTDQRPPRAQAKS